MKKNVLFFLIGSCWIATSCQKTTYRDVPETGAKLDLLSIMRVNYNFSLFLHAVERTGLDTLLSPNRSFTLLMPDNLAFSQIGITSNASLDSLSPDTLTQLVKLHLLPRVVPSSDITRTINSSYLTADAIPVYVTNDGPGNGLSIRVDGVPLVSVDNIATNGIIDVLQRPLQLPAPSIKAFLLTDTAYSFFATALRNFGLLDQLDSAGPFTVLAPLNSAFLSQGITLDSINKLDTLHYKKFLFGVSIRDSVRIFSSDFSDAVFFVYPNGTGGEQNFNIPFGYVEFPGKDGYLVEFDLSGPNWEVFDPAQSGLNPNYSGPLLYLGPNQHSAQLFSFGWGSALVDPNHVAVNGVVHGMNDILVYPQSVMIP